MTKRDTIKSVQADLEWWNEVFPGLVYGWSNRESALLRFPDGSTQSITATMRNYVADVRKGARS